MKNREKHGEPHANASIQITQKNNTNTARRRRVNKIKIIESN